MKAASAFKTGTRKGLSKIEEEEDEEDEVKKPNKKLNANFYLIGIGKYATMEERVVEKAKEERRAVTIT